MADTTLEEREMSSAAGVTGTGSGGAPKPAKIPVHPLSDDARTLFLSALPEDVAEREIHNLFRFFGGYEGCSIIRPDKKSPMCFVVFSDHKSAVFAKEALSGMRLDPFTAQTLRIDFAHSNSKVKRVPRDFFEGDRAQRATLVTSERSHFTHPIHPPMAHLPPFAFSPYINAFPAPGKPHPDLPDPSLTAGAPNPAGPVLGMEGHEPSATIFVGNIHKDVHRNDLHRLFSLIPGLKDFRMNFSNKDHPIAFAEFHDVNGAITAMKTLQGAPVGSSRIRLEFSRSQKKPSPLEPAGLRETAPQNNGFRI